MSLTALVPEMALYGFVGAYASHTIGLPITAVFILWFLTASIASHRNDPLDTTTADLIIALNFKVPISLLFGIGLGLIYAWAFRFVPLVQWEFWTVSWRFLPPDAPPSVTDDHVGRNRTTVFVFNSLFTFYTLAVIVAAVGVFFLLGRFEPEVSSTVSLGIGFFALLVGGGVALYILFRWFVSDSPSDLLNFMFALAISFIALTPALYDFLLSFRPFNQVVFHIGLIVVLVAVAYFHWQFFASVDARTNLLLANDLRAAPSQTGLWSIGLRWFILWLIVALIYVAAGVTDELTFSAAAGTGDLNTVLIVVFVVFLLLAFVGIAYGVWAWFAGDAYSSYSRADQGNYLVPDTQLLPPLLLAPVEPAVALGVVESGGQYAQSMRSRRAATQINADSALNALTLNKKK